MAFVLSPTIESELRRIATSEGCELLEVEYHGGLLRFILDHPDGVTLERCESFSNRRRPVTRSPCHCGARKRPST